MQERGGYDRRTALKTIALIGGAGLGLGSFATAPATAYDSALESYYELDGSAATDASGNGNDGTVDGASSGASGISNACFSFDGVDDSIVVPHVLSGRSQGSYSVWVNADSFGEDRAILGDWNGGHLVLWYDVGTDQWGFGARLNGATRIVKGGSPSTGEWTHLAMTYDGNTLRLYVDATSVDSIAASGSFDAESDIQLGTDEGTTNDNHNYWDGRIDEVRTYARALSASEVSELYNNPGSANLGGSDSVTDIEYSYQGHAFDPDAPVYSPDDEWIFPTIVETSNLDDPLGTYHLYTSPHGTSATVDGNHVGIALFYADSLDPGSWTAYSGNPIIDSSNYSYSENISSPHVLWVDEYDKLLLYEHSSNHNTHWWWNSDGDGIDFNYGGVAVDSTQVAGSPAASYARVYDYSIPDRSNSYTMFFMDNQGGTRHIRLATSDDAKNWTVDPDEVVTPQSYHAGNVSNPFFFRYDGEYLVAFHDSTARIYAMECGKNIDKENYRGKIMEPVSQDNDGIAGPFFVKDGAGNGYIYYAAGPRQAKAISYRTLTDPDDVADLTLFDNSS